MLLLARADALLYQAKAAGRGRQMIEERAVDKPQV
jgi:PleD family two-component response regulator